MPLGLCNAPATFQRCMLAIFSDLVEKSIEVFMDCKPVLTPIIKSTRLSHTTDSPYEDPAGNRRLIGKLLYLTTTRPDISYFVQQLSQFLSCPQRSHYQAAIRVLIYLKGNPGQGLFYPADSLLQLKAFSDSDWASCSDTKRSLSGYSVFLGNSLISWKCKK
ncbi:uncharacterized protein LOC109788560 [Cajanus cajan]|uniref:uncharacterized protein LOC109788560 n=1 Tax=Cajanus cajan TaxID=3821 RepID=UPI00098DD307|nr:uncharacterized protein LOC109788560 [Cajanus cajan]